MYSFTSFEFVDEILLTRAKLLTVMIYVPSLSVSSLSKGLPNKLDHISLAMNFTFSMAFLCSRILDSMSLKVKLRPKVPPKPSTDDIFKVRSTSLW